MNYWIKLGAVSGFLGVSIGAFGAHWLKQYILPDLLESYRTGVMYHLLHSVVITAIGLSGKTEYSKAALFFLLGIILFSFSLYAYSLTGIRIFPIFTPVGGVSFLTGWVLIFTASFKK